MSIEATSPHLVATAPAKVCAPEQSLPVACLLIMSGGFLDVFTWLSLDGVFANSQTGNVVFLGMYAAMGRWHEAANHFPPIAAFLAGAWLAIRIRAPLLCLAGEIVSLVIAMWLLPHAPSGPLTIMGISFGVALQTASFRRVENWKYLSVTVTGNMLRGVQQLTSADPEAARGAKIMLTICLMFLVGTAIGGFTTVHLAANSLVIPIGLLACALWLCCRHRYRRYLG
jgi:uncharacterized membrane protein YoaK (UPF0700 family)